MCVWIIVRPPNKLSQPSAQFANCPSRCHVYPAVDVCAPSLSRMARRFIFIHFRTLFCALLHSQNGKIPVFNPLRTLSPKTPGVVGRHLMRYLRIRLDDTVKPCTMNTYVKSSSNPFAINTYKNARLKVEQNQHLQKNRGEGGCPMSSPALSRNVAPVWGLRDEMGKQQIPRLRSE